MKRKIFLLGLLSLGFFCSGNAQVLELISFVTEKVVKAIDLKVQEMQNNVIALQNLQREAENELSKGQLSEIGALAQKQKELYRAYYTSLQQVKPILGSGTLVQKIVEEQKQLVSFYNRAVMVVKTDTHLTEKERIDFMTNCAVILEDSYTTIRKLNEALKPNNIVATDAERLQLMNQSASQVDLQYHRLQILFSRCRALSESRAKDALKKKKIKKLYGL